MRPRSKTLEYRRGDRVKVRERFEARTGVYLAPGETARVVDTGRAGFAAEFEVVDLRLDHSRRLVRFVPANVLVRTR